MHLMIVPSEVSSVTDDKEQSLLVCGSNRYKTSQLEKGKFTDLSLFH